MAEPRPGDVIAFTYRLDELLGRGAMGAVWRATEQRVGRQVALKLLSGEVDQTSWLRFQREAELVARVEGGGVVRVHATGVEQGRPWLAMQLIEGRDLSALLKREGRMDPARAASLVEAVGRTLARCHAAGVVHRDLKPGNVLVRADDGAPVLVDFGLATARDAGRLTQSGALLGTPVYMAPEQILDPRRVDPRVDVYALGAILHHVLTGEAPYQGSALKVLESKTRGTPPSQAPADVDRGLLAIASRAMHSDPGARYPSAAALVEAVVAWRLAAATPRAPSHWPRRLRRVLIPLALLLLLGGGAAAIGRRAARGAVERGAGLSSRSLAGPLAPAAELEAAAAALRRGRWFLLAHERPALVLAHELPRLEALALLARAADALAAGQPAEGRALLERAAQRSPGTLRDLEPALRLDVLLQLALAPDDFPEWAARLPQDDPRLRAGALEHAREQLDRLWWPALDEALRGLAGGQGAPVELARLGAAARALPAAAPDRVRHVQATEAAVPGLAARLQALWGSGGQEPFLAGLAEVLHACPGARAGPALSAALVRPFDDTTDGKLVAWEDALWRHVPEVQLPAEFLRFLGQASATDGPVVEFEPRFLVAALRRGGGIKEGYGWRRLAERLERVGLVCSIRAISQAERWCAAVLELRALAGGTSKSPWPQGGGATPESLRQGEIAVRKVLEAEQRDLAPRHLGEALMVLATLLWGRAWDPHGGPADPALVAEAVALARQARAHLGLSTVQPVIEAFELEASQLPPERQLELWEEARRLFASSPDPLMAQDDGYARNLDYSRRRALRGLSEAHAALGQSEPALERAREAVQALEAATRRVPEALEESLLRRWLAGLLVQAGRRPEAEALLRAATESTRRNSWELTEALVELLLQRGDREGARAAVQDLARLRGPDNREVRLLEERIGPP